MTGSSISVLGEAVVRAEPDEALVWIDVSSVDASAAVALAEVVARSEAFVALLEELAIDPSDRSTIGIETQEEYDRGGSGRLAGHRATSRWVVRLKDAGIVGLLVTRAGQELGARIAGPSWRISLEHPARLEAAKHAAANAQRKAAAYAAGLTAELGELLNLTEPHVHRPRVFEPHGGTVVAMSAQAGRSLPVEAGEHEALAVIEATFALKVVA